MKNFNFYFLQFLDPTDPDDPFAGDFGYVFTMDGKRIAYDRGWNYPDDMLADAHQTASIYGMTIFTDGYKVILQSRDWKFRLPDGAIFDPKVTVII